MALETISSFDEYPHRVFANVILVDNKIVRYQIGNYRYTKNSIWCHHQPRIVAENEEKIQIRSRSFLVHNRKEHNKAFEKDAVKFMKKYEIHENYEGSKPY